jgi:hypothetical protein
MSEGLMTKTKDWQFIIKLMKAIALLFVCKRQNVKSLIILLLDLSVQRGLISLHILLLWVPLVG